MVRVMESNGRKVDRSGGGKEKCERMWYLYICYIFALC